MMWVYLKEADGTKVSVNLDHVSSYTEAEDGKTVLWMDNGKRIKTSVTYDEMQSEIRWAMEGNK